MDNPGLKVGLAQNFNYDQRVTDLARQNDAKRQAQIYSEAKSKMLADDFDYNNAMNAWDNEAVKTFAQGKLKELGAFVRSNPDFETNLDKRIAYKNMVKELKDNKALNEGLQVDGNVKMMQAYMQDPKNAPLVQSEDFAPIMQAYQNYIKTGSTDGVTGNRKLFTFTPPEELYDITPDLAKFAKMTRMSGEQRVGLGPGSGSIKQFVTDQDKLLAANGMLNDAVTGRRLKREYNHYVSGLPEGQKPMTDVQYTVQRMNPYFDNPKYNNYSYHVSDGGKGSGKGSSGSAFNPLDVLGNDAKIARQNGVKWVSANPAGVEEILTGGKGYLNTQGMFFEKSDGDYMPVKGMITKNYTTSGSKATYTKDGLLISSTIQMPLDEAIDFFDSPDVLEDPWLGSPKVGDKYSDRISISKDENGNDVANIQVLKEVNSKNASENMAYGHGSGGKSEGVDSQSYSQPKTISRSALIQKYGEENANQFIQKYGQTINLVD